MRLAVFLLGVAGASVAHMGQQRVDAARRENTIEERLGMLPSGEALEWVSMGFETQIADWMWIRSVLVFGENSAEQSDPHWQDWLERSLNVSIILDPHWHSLYSYGGLMLKVAGDVDASNRLLQKALERFPEDHYFAFSLGANHYLQGEEASTWPLDTGVGLSLASVLPGSSRWQRDIREGLEGEILDRAPVLMATQWMLHASTLKDAPAWYAGAANSFIARSNEREVAIRFLSEQLDGETDERLIESLTAQLNTHLHALHSERLTQQVEAFKEREGHLPRDLWALVDKGDLLRLPKDPYEELWVIDVDEVVRSTRVIKRIRKAALASERQMLMRLWLKP
jgi:tetratricopeptide (TPR) repeat protein